eukprot:jgi/Mesvir1/16661/Mv12272-RA.3
MVRLGSGEVQLEETSYRLLPHGPPAGTPAWLESGGIRRPYGVDTELPEEEADGDQSPQGLLQGERAEWGAVANLDKFFVRVYNYYLDNGFWCTIINRLLNVITLGFTIGLSGFLLLCVDWSALLAKCGSPVKAPTCDVLEAAIDWHPLQHLTRTGALVVVYLLVFSLYWAWNCVRFVLDLRPLWEISHFYNHRLGISERELASVSWPDIVERMVRVQGTLRLCVVKQRLSAHDIVCRIMRKENYLIGLINQDVLRLKIELPGLRARTILTKTLKWNLYWCILDSMFDDNFRIRHDFANDERSLRRRLRLMAALNALLSPFIAVFMLTYVFLRHAERFYHQPASFGARRWTSLAKLKFREFNELPHLLRQRLNASYPHAVAYSKQFSAPLLTMLASFVAFVTGALAAVLLGLALVEESMLEAQLFGRGLVWYAAICGTILAVSRSFVADEPLPFQPEAIMEELAKHSHFFPRRWRGRCHTEEVHREFEEMFQYKAVQFLEEMLSVFATPVILWSALPQASADILAFIRESTTVVDGVGAVCSLSAFDFQRHGNATYGAPVHAPREHCSHQGKMEKSLLSFKSYYPFWEPDELGQAFLDNVSNFRAAEEQKQAEAIAQTVAGLVGSIHAGAQSAQGGQGALGQIAEHEPQNGSPSTLQGATPGPLSTSAGEPSQGAATREAAAMRDSGAGPYHAAPIMGDGGPHHAWPLAPPLRHQPPHPPALPRALLDSGLLGVLLSSLQQHQRLQGGPAWGGAHGRSGAESTWGGSSRHQPSYMFGGSYLQGSAVAAVRSGERPVRLGGKDRDMLVNEEQVLQLSWLNKFHEKLREQYQGGH